ncbi:MAG: porin family protein [Novosphingobium sp.]|nr:porin family protein [Novosphingobium sp.]MCP5401578.1 porin family protein [Novosphingobium sp.]
MNKSLPILATALAGAVSFATPAAAETFDGPYVGVTAGWNRAEVADRTLDAATIDAEAARDSAVIGIYGGYNHKVTDSIVLGVEAGLAAAIDDNVRAQSSGQALTVDPRYSFDLSARAGYLVNSKTLIYARGGYANQRIRNTLETASGTARSSDNLDGWTVGGGVEYAITPHISARAEYRYSDFGRSGGNFDRHQTLIGVSYNF